MSRLPIFDDDGEDISRSMWVEDFVILRSRYCNFKAHTRNSTLYVVLHRRAGKKKKTSAPRRRRRRGGTVEALRPAPIWQPKMSPFPNALSLASSFEVSPAQAIVCSTFFLSDCVASGHDSSLLRFAPRRHVVTQELELPALHYTSVLRASAPIKSFMFHSSTELCGLQCYTQKQTDR